VLLHASKTLVLRKFDEDVESILDIEKPCANGERLKLLESLAVLTPRGSAKAREAHGEPLWRPAPTLPFGGIVGRARIVDVITQPGAPPGMRCHLSTRPPTEDCPCRSPWYGGGFALVLADVASELERSLHAFDNACHEALVTGRRDIAAQTLAQALVYAASDEERAIVREVLGVLDAAGLDGVYRVGGMRGGAVLMWRTGDAKRPGAAELRDDGVRALEYAGLRVTMRGCWDFEVRR